jgi:cytochrome c oxidase subunit 2
MGLPPGASSVADGIDTLHAAIALSTLVVGALLFGLTTRFVLRYRRRSPEQRTERIESSPKMETAIVAFVTIAFVAFWVVGFRQYGELTAPPRDAETIYVDAKQWMWKFGYTDGRATNDVLSVPAGKAIKLVMTSRDVIHSFYVPAFRIKQDILPGRYTTVWFIAKEPGTYPIYCAEFCGVSHSAMLGSVNVVSAAEYETFKREGAATDILARGREVATRRGCIACHSLDGKTGVGPTFKGLYGSERTLTDGRHVVADDGYLTRAIVEPNADVVVGFPAAMPVYRGVLEPAEVAALLELVRGTK